jgi:hypothetical protein
VELDLQRHYVLGRHRGGAVRVTAAHCQHASVPNVASKQSLDNQQSNGDQLSYAEKSVTGESSGGFDFGDSFDSVFELYYR